MRKNSSDQAKNIHTAIKRFRDQKGWSQGQLAIKIGIHVKQLAKYERGINCPSIDVLIKLARVFNIDLDSLVFGQRAYLDDITDPELVDKLSQIEKLDKKSQEALMTMIDALILQHRIKQVTKE